jgi:hypothetical protein
LRLKEPLFQSRIKRLDRMNQSLKIFTDQSDHGTVILRPARLNGKSLLLMNLARTADKK